MESEALGVLAKSHGPEAIAVAVVALADETDVAAEADFLFHGAEIGAEVVVADDAEAFVFEVGAEAEGEFFFDRGGEGDGFDFPAEAMLGALGELDAHAGGVDAGAFELGKFEQRIEFALDFVEGFILEFEAEAIVGDVADLFADIEDAEIVLTRDINAEVEAWLMVVS